MLDGASRIHDVAAAVAADGQPALAITDHGNMYGVLDFYAACKEGGIKPILGIELYMAKDSVDERPTRTAKTDETLEGRVGEKLYYHLTALAKRPKGIGISFGSVRKHFCVDFTISLAASGQCWSSTTRG